MVTDNLILFPVRNQAQPRYNGIYSPDVLREFDRLDRLIVALDAEIRRLRSELEGRRG